MSMTVVNLSIVFGIRNGIECGYGQVRICGTDMMIIALQSGTVELLGKQNAIMDLERWMDEEKSWSREITS